MNAVDRAIKVLRFKGHEVWRMDFPPPPFPGLYRVSGGPEITEAQLLQTAEDMPPTYLATGGIVIIGVD